MADVLAEQAGWVKTSNIATYDRQNDEIFDFLKPHGSWAISDAVITNPPCGKGNGDARLFAEYSLTRCKGAGRFTRGDAWCRWHRQSRRRSPSRDRYHGYPQGKGGRGRR